MFFQHFSRTPTAKYKKKKEKKIYLPTYPIFFGTVTGNKQFFLGLMGAIYCRMFIAAQITTALGCQRLRTHSASSTILNLMYADDIFTADVYLMHVRFNGISVICYIALYI